MNNTPSQNGWQTAHTGSKACRHFTPSLMPLTVASDQAMLLWRSKVQAVDMATAGDTLGIASHCGDRYGLRWRANGTGDFFI